MTSGLACCSDNQLCFRPLAGMADEQQGVAEAPGMPEPRQNSAPDTSSAVGRSPRPSGSRPRPVVRSGDRELLLLRAVNEVEVRTSFSG